MDNPQKSLQSRYGLARFTLGFTLIPITLARDRSSPNQKHITVWEGLRRSYLRSYLLKMTHHSFTEDEVLAHQIQSDYSIADGLVAISAVAATWFLAPRSLNMLSCDSPLSVSHQACNISWMDTLNVLLGVNTWARISSSE